MQQNFNLTPEAREERRRVVMLLEQWSRPVFLQSRLGAIGNYELSVINKIVLALKKDVLGSEEAENPEA